MDPRQWLFDKRVVRRNLEKGVLTWKSYNEYVKSTADLEGEYEYLALDSQEEQAKEDARAKAEAASAKAKSTEE